MNVEEKRIINKRFNEILGVQHPYEQDYFNGEGIDKLCHYILTRDRDKRTWSLMINCDPSKMKGSKIMVDYTTAIFKQSTQEGYANRANFYESICIAAAYALGILIQLNRVVPKERNDDDETDY